MKLKDVQGCVEKTIPISARIPKDYKEFIDKNNISVKKLIIKAIDEINSKNSATAKTNSG